jgi:hypothetical protein
LLEHFGGACRNCKWRDYTFRYSVQDIGPREITIINLTSDDDEDRGNRDEGRALLSPRSRGQPLAIKDDDGPPLYEIEKVN